MVMPLPTTLSVLGQERPSLRLVSPSVVVLPTHPVGLG